jgi:ankyrin repeat protein
MHTQIGSGVKLLTAIRNEQVDLVRRKLEGEVVFRKLLGHNVLKASNPNTIEHFTGKTALMIACEVGSIEIVKKLLEQPTINATLLDSENKSVFYYASRHVYNYLANWVIHNVPMKMYYDVFFKYYPSSLFFAQLFKHFISFKSTEHLDDGIERININTNIGNKTLLDVAILFSEYDNYIMKLLDEGAIFYTISETDTTIAKIKAFIKLSIDIQDKLIENTFAQKKITDVINIIIYGGWVISIEQFNQLIPYLINQPLLINKPYGRNTTLFEYTMINSKVPSSSKILEKLLTVLDADYKKYTKYKTIPINIQIILISQMLDKEDYASVIDMILRVATDKELQLNTINIIIPFLVGKPELINLYIEKKSLFIFALINNYHDTLYKILNVLDAEYKDYTNFTISDIETQTLLINRMIRNDDFKSAIYMILLVATDKELQIKKIIEILPFLKDKPALINLRVVSTLHNRYIEQDSLFKFALINNHEILQKILTELNADYKAYKQYIISDIETQKILINQMILKKDFESVIDMILRVETNKELQIQKIIEILPFLIGKPTLINLQIGGNTLFKFALINNNYEILQKILTELDTNYKDYKLYNISDIETQKILINQMILKKDITSAIDMILRVVTDKPLQDDTIIRLLPFIRTNPELINYNITKDAQKHISKINDSAIMPSLLMYALSDNNILRILLNELTTVFNIKIFLTMEPSLYTMEIQRIIFDYTMANQFISDAIYMIIYMENTYFVQEIIPYLNESNINTFINKDFRDSHKVQMRRIQITLLDVCIKNELIEPIKKIITIKPTKLEPYTRELLTKCDNIEILKILLVYSLSFNTKDDTLFALAQAIDKISDRNYSLLTEIVKNINQYFINITCYGKNMLYYAVEFNDEASIVILLNKNIDIFTFITPKIIIKILYTGYNIFELKHLESTYNIFDYFHSFEIKYIQEITDYLQIKEDYNNILLSICSCSVRHTFKADFISRLLSNPYIFIDCIDNLGRNALMLSIKYNTTLISSLLAKNININAINIDRDTPLHYAIKKDSSDIVKLLCSIPNIIPIIPNKHGTQSKTALELTRGTHYEQLLLDTIGISQNQLLNRPWRGVTLDYIKQFDIAYLIGVGIPIDYMKNTYCPSCLLNTGKGDNACYHLKHKCSIEQEREYKSALNGEGGFPPYYYINGVNREGISNLCHVCAEGNFTPNSPNHGGWSTCSNGYKFKYYRLYLIIQKFIELHARADLTIKQAMDQVIEAGLRAIYDRHVFEPIVDTVFINQTFLPTIHPFTNDKSFKELYPSIGVVKLIPNMRDPKDVIENNLMPQIISYLPIKNENETSTDPDDIEYDSPEDIFSVSTHEKFIQFRHREYTAPFNIKTHANVSTKTFLGIYTNYVSNKTEDYFGKCILNPNIPPPDKCTSYIYPEELGILINSGVITHEQYISYRTEFHKSNKIQIEYSPSAKDYFIPNPIQPVVQECPIQAQAGGFSTYEGKYLKYKMKYQELKKKLIK